MVIPAGVNWSNFKVFKVLWNKAYHNALLNQLYYILRSIISIAAGFLFKPAILAGAIIIIGDILGAFGTFIFGRYIFSDWVKTQIEKRPMFTALNSVIADEGTRFILKL